MRKKIFDRNWRICTSVRTLVLGVDFDKKTATEQLAKKLKRRIQAIRAEDDPPNIAIDDGAAANLLGPTSTSSPTVAPAAATAPASLESMFAMMMAHQQQLQQQQAEQQKVLMGLVESMRGPTGSGGDQHGGGAEGGARNRTGGNRQDRGGSDGGSHGPDSAKVTAKKPAEMGDNITYKEFKKWLATWDNYVRVTELDKAKRSKQLGIFFGLCSSDWLDKLNYAVGIPQDTTMTLAEIINKIREYLRNQQNIVVDRWKLLRRKQADGESFDDFMTALYSMAEDAEVATMTGDDWKTTLLIHGLEDDETRQEVLSKKPALSLDATVELCRNRELAEKDGRRMKGSRSSVNANSGGARGRSRSRSRSRSRQDDPGA